MKNGNHAASKQDLAELERRLTKATVELESRLTKAMAEMNAQLTKAMTEQEERLQEAIHDGETRLLKAFYSYAEAAQKHFVDLERSDLSLRERLGIMDARITELERRLNMPPPRQQSPATR